MYPDNQQKFLQKQSNHGSVLHIISLHSVYDETSILLPSIYSKKHK